MALKISNTGEGDSTIAVAVGMVTGRERYDIHIENPLPYLDNAPALAFDVTPLRDTGRQFYALVCDPKIPPRVDQVSGANRLSAPGIIHAVDWSVVDWTPEQRRCPAIILEKPGGGRVFEGPNSERAPMLEDPVIKRFLTPAAQALKLLFETGYTHRAVRPDNLYFSDVDEAASDIMLGEFLSAPPALAQHVVCEPIESGQSAPGGRGYGKFADDMYSLGVCLAALLGGKFPCQGKSDDEILRMKIMQGSYPTICGDLRVPSSLIEVMRGLLNDHAEDRWDIEDLLLWLNGRRLSPKQPAIAQRGSRPLTLEGEQHLTARSLAMGMARHWEAARSILVDGTLDGWLRRSLGEESRTEAVNAAKVNTGPEDMDRWIARTIIALDPAGPIRLRDLSATVGGIGGYAAIYADNTAARSAVTGVINMSLAGFWLESQVLTRADAATEVNRVEKMRAVLSRTGHGNGLERVIYDLCTDFPCRSPLFERDYVCSVEMVIPALDRYVRNSGGDVSRLIDREIAAFISSRFRQSISGHLRALDDGTPAEKAVSQIRILGALEEAGEDAQSYPDLTSAAARLLQPMLEVFKSRAAREALSDRLDKAAKAGRMQALVAILDDDTALERDRRGFVAATKAFTRSAINTLNVRKAIANQDKIAADIGGQISTGLAGMVAATACFVIAAIRLL